VVTRSGLASCGLIGRPVPCDSVRRHRERWTGAALRGPAPVKLFTNSVPRRRMASTVHGGSIGRWFEELCRIRYHRLRALAVDDATKLRPKALPRTGGVYVFWWTGDVGLLCQAACNRDITLVGPGSRPVHLRVDDEWLGVSTGLP